MRKLVISGFLIAFPLVTLADGCSIYPYTDGLHVEDVAGGTKILATASATVSIDDIDSIKDARDEATLQAKALISHFLSEDIFSDESVAKTVNESKKTQGTNKEVSREEMITRVKNLRSTSRSLLRGVVLLGDCYTKGQEVRVSVGIKPETIKSAGNLSQNINNSLSKGASSSQGSGSSQGTTTPSEGYSNTSRLNNF